MFSCREQHGQPALVVEILDDALLPVQGLQRSAHRCGLLARAHQPLPVLGTSHPGQAQTLPDVGLQPSEWMAADGHRATHLPRSASNIRRADRFLSGLLINHIEDGLTKSFIVNSVLQSAMLCQYPG